MAFSFSNDGSDAIATKLNILQLEGDLNSENLLENFDIEGCVKWIVENSYRRIVLQFPEELFSVSTAVCFQLQKLVGDGTDFAILAEKKYGSCCVDEIGAEHFDADSLIHFGATCLSFHPRLPVRFVFGKKQMDVEDFVMQVKSLCPVSGSILHIVYDLCFHHMRENLVSSLENSNIKYSCAEVVLPGERDSFSTNFNNPKTTARSKSPDKDSPDDETSERIILGRKFILPKDRTNNRIIYIGSDDNFLATLSLILNGFSCSLYDPFKKLLYNDVTRTSKALMKRYYMMEKARDATFIGILVGTLDVSKYLEIIERIKSTAKMAGKKCRVYSPGTLNPAKLANLPEFEVYVLVACPLNSFVDSSDYYQPIVTPHEMLLACSHEFKWSDDYKLDFRQILADLPETADRSQHVTMDVSLVSGRVRTIGVEEDDINYTDGNGTIAERATSGSIVKAGDFLQTRSWKGLETHMGETPVTQFIEGLTGIASGYIHEAPNEKENV